MKQNARVKPIFEVQRTAGYRRLEILMPELSHQKSKANITVSLDTNVVIQGKTGIRAAATDFVK